MEIIFEYDIQLRYVKDGERYRCICDKLKIAGSSKKSFQEAEAKLFDMFDIKIRNYDFSIKLKVKEIKQN